MPSNSPPSLSLLPKNLIFHQTLILTITFFAYASLHASRKPPSIVKSVLGPEISKNGTNPLEDLGFSQMGWPPFNGTRGTQRLGELDLAFLSSYAIGMFFSGHFADNTDLRLFLSSGMLLSGAFTVAFGCGYWIRIHEFLYYAVVQILCGVFQSTGWPAVVAIVGNWFGKSKRGLIMGIWTSHTSVGNILGSIVASSMLKFGWGWSFFWPGFFVFLIGIVVYFFLVVRPEHIGLSLPSEIEFIPIEGSDHGEAEHLGLLQSKDSKSSEEDKVLEMEEINSTGAIGFMEAWKLPGVASFAICLFFSKLVAYTFLYWLPFYIRHTGNQDDNLLNFGVVLALIFISGKVGNFDMGFML